MASIPSSASSSLSKANSPSPVGTNRLKPGLLGDDGTPRVRKHTLRSLNQPQRAAAYPLLAHADLALGTLNERAIAVGCVRHARGIDQLPPVRGQTFEIPCLFRMNGKRDEKLLVRLVGQRHELAPRVRLLPVKHPVVGDGPVPTPVRDRGERVVCHAPGSRPLTEQDWLSRRDPVATTRRDDTICPAERRTNRHEMGVTVEADVDGFGGVPELIEAGIEVE